MRQTDTPDSSRTPMNLPDLIRQTVPQGLTLRPFQIPGVEFLVERRRALIADDPGLGKTVQLIVAACLARTFDSDWRMHRALVLCPKSMLITWEREIQKWGVGGFPGSGPIEWDVRNYDQLVVTRHRHSLTEHPGWNILICDESHQAIKNPDAQRAHFIINTLIPKSQRVWLATATPASRSGLDYFLTLKILLPTLFGKAWTKWAFQKEFCKQVRDRFAHSGFKYEGFKNTAKLREIFQRCCIRRKKEDVEPDLPEIQYTDISVEIPRDVLAANLELDIDEVVDCITNNRPFPAHVAKVIRATGLAKLDAVTEIISNLPLSESLVVFGWHRAVVGEMEDRIRGLGTEVAKITGEVNNPEVRQQIIDKFQRKELTRLCLNIQSGGVGITLTAASTALYVEFPHSPIHWIQSMNRIHRIGSTHEKVNIVRVFAKGSIDEKIWAVLMERMDALGEVGL